MEDNIILSSHKKISLQKGGTVYPYQYPSNFIFCPCISAHSSQDYISKERYERSLDPIRKLT